MSLNRSSLSARSLIEQVFSPVGLVALCSSISCAGFLIDQLLLNGVCKKARLPVAYCVFVKLHHHSVGIQTV